MQLYTEIAVLYYTIILCRFIHASHELTAEPVQREVCVIGQDCFRSRETVSHMREPSAASNRPPSVCVETYSFLLAIRIVA
jgi:hypothetical protein